MAPKARTACVLFLEPVDITLFGRSVFLEVIELRTLRWEECPGLHLGWALNATTNVLLRGGAGKDLAAEEKAQSEVYRLRS